MKLFLFKFLLFLAIGLIVGEIIVRQMHLTSDIPQRYLDHNHIQKYIPGQTGYWKGGEHTWQINKFGWVGAPPSSNSNLITIIGDSFIENFMNPDACRQGALLKARLPKFNFLEAGRSGVSFIEAMEIANSLDSLKPRWHLLYLNTSDFIESVRDINPHVDITQVDLKNRKIVPGIMKAAGLKRILYNWKFAYYLFNRFPLDQISSPGAQHVPIPTQTDKPQEVRMLKPLLDFVKQEYTVSNKIVVFHPNVPESVIREVAAAGFAVITLNSKGTHSWTFDYDIHWTCHGHQQAASQVETGLSKLVNTPPIVRYH
ncbi:hypothetical protein [Dyadobacter crusticola]|uniref:hypothetical protein n=1 Tax=Dyadobacter crusticola TaxID=292407 RepID=UPI0004E24125|nr:hypothetical protein [Dyadobacter crusticola]